MFSINPLQYIFKLNMCVNILQMDIRSDAEK